jgi:hypothetical protein
MTNSTTTPDINALKTRLKTIWESVDYGVWYDAIEAKSPQVVQVTTARGRARTRTRPTMSKRATVQPRASGSSAAIAPRIACGSSGGVCTGSENR